MSNLRILIVEDELLTATDIEEKLTSLGYTIVGIAQNSESAIALTKTKYPDVILMDISINGKLDGIDTARIILEEWHGPIIFVTAYSDKEYVNRAKALLPAAYLLKPFNVSQFAIHLELAISNFLNQKFSETNKRQVPDSVFIMINQTYQKIKKNEIIFFEASGSYSVVQTINGQHIVSTTLKNFESQLDDPGFCRIHRKYLINLEYLKSLDSNSVSLSNINLILPIGDLYKQSFLSKIQIIKTK